MIEVLEDVEARPSAMGWTAPGVIAAIAGGLVVLAAFVAI